MKFTTFIPLNLNDGSAISQDELNQVLADLSTRFGGLTLEGEVDGRWIHDGQTFHDRNLKVSIVTDNSRYQEARQAVVDIGKRFDQLAMFFEVAYFDGVEILQID